jgi:UPF0716 protein FxsA
MPRLLGLAGIGLFVAVVVEIAVFIVVVHWLGAALAVLLVLVTSLLGAWLLRREGGRAWRQLREGALSGQPAVGDLNPGLLGRLTGGLLLAIPGFVTDVVGLALLVPAVRRAAGAGAQRLVERRMSSSAAGDLFGPRRVRVRPGRPYQPDTGRDTSPLGAPIEGEIIDPR